MNQFKKFNFNFECREVERGDVFNLFFNSRRSLRKYGQSEIRKTWMGAS